jgi:hypothetical protein
MPRSRNYIYDLQQKLYRQAPLGNSRDEMVFSGNLVLTDEQIDKWWKLHKHSPAPRCTVSSSGEFRPPNIWE